MSEHFITKCSCGEVISQCRCPSKEKELIVVKDGCDKCRILNKNNRYESNYIKKG